MDALKSGGNFYRFCETKTDLRVNLNLIQLYV